MLLADKKDTIDKEKEVSIKDKLVKKNAPRPGTAPFVHEAVTKLLNGYKGFILDAGAGKGILSRKLKDMGFKVYACDVDPEWFEAREDGIEFIQADLNQKLPYEDEYFDFVCCVETIEHLWNPWGLIQEFYRILKPQGKLIVTTPNILTIFSRIRFLLSGRFLSFGKKNFDILGHISPFPQWQLEGMLKKIGFEDVKVTFNAGWIPILEKQIPIKNILTGNILIISCQKP